MNDDAKDSAENDEDSIRQGGGVVFDDTRFRRKRNRSGSDSTTRAGLVPMSVLIRS